MIIIAIYWLLIIGIMVLVWQTMRIEIKQTDWNPPARIIENKYKF